MTSRLHVLTPWITASSFLAQRRVASAWLFTWQKKTTSWIRASTFVIQNDPHPLSCAFFPTPSSTLLADGTASLAEPRTGLAAPPTADPPTASTCGCFLFAGRLTQAAQEARWLRPLPGTPAPGLVAGPDGGQRSRRLTGRRSLLPWELHSMAAALIPRCRCRQWAAQVFVSFLVNFV